MLLHTDFMGLGIAEFGYFARSLFCAKQRCRPERREEPVLSGAEWDLAVRMGIDLNSRAWPRRFTTFTMTMGGGEAATKRNYLYVTAYLANLLANRSSDVTIDGPD